MLLKGGILYILNSSFLIVAIWYTDDADLLRKNTDKNGFFLLFLVMTKRIKNPFLSASSL
ncbi:hypothetical protein IW18_21095 [Flavobacterium hibernum]|uniref:Uncharacterized protein n=1 Tax=Flavobacterium hibernum TaxID=37752 RepID=A0A0D0EVB5_9FLAO|nr:hypothetical protein IW18_21095 [Flavobacterium hibernum]PTS93790.1 hypothetical protein DBR27_18355 [Flavobacterium sp. HMWF030]